jgi:hypothetical protein
MLRNQVDYENTRIAAGSALPAAVDISNEEQTMGVEINVSNFTALNLFK